MRRTVKRAASRGLVGTLAEPLSALERHAISGWLADVRDYLAERADSDDRPAMAATWREQAARLSQLLADYQPSRRVPDRVLHAWASVVAAGYAGEASRRFSIDRLRRAFRAWLKDPDYEREPRLALRIALTGNILPGLEGDVIGANLVGEAYRRVTALLLAIERGTAVYIWGTHTSPRGPGRTREGIAAAVAASRDWSIGRGGASPLTQYEFGFASVDAAAQRLEQRAVQSLAYAARELDLRGVEREQPAENDLPRLRDMFARGGDSIVVVGNALGVSEDLIREETRGLHGARSRWGARTNGKTRPAR